MRPNLSTFRHLLHALRENGALGHALHVYQGMREVGSGREGVMVAVHCVPFALLWPGLEETGAMASQMVPPSPPSHIPTHCGAMRPAARALQLTRVESRGHSENYRTPGVLSDLVKPDLVAARCEIREGKTRQGFPVAS